MRGITKTILICAAMTIYVGKKVFPSELEDEDAHALNNYSYATTLDFGGYWTEDRAIRAFNIPFAFRLRSIKGDQWGIKLLLPVTVGVTDIDVRDDEGNEESLDLRTITVVPGLEFEIPLRDDWTLKPFGQLGGGKDLSSDEGAFIFALGLKSSFVFPRWNDYRFTLGNGIRFYGHDATDNERKDVTTIGTGLDIIAPLELNLFGTSLSPSFYFIHYLHLDEVEFERRKETPLTVDNEFEFALSMVGNNHISFGLFNLERLGLAYRYGDNVQVVRLVFRFPF